MINVIHPSCSVSSGLLYLGWFIVFPSSAVTAFKFFYISIPSDFFVLFCSQETKEEKSSYTCPLCEKICTTQHQLTMHIRQVRRVPALDFLLLSVSGLPECVLQ